MKTLVSALALLIGSKVMAVAADQTLKHKLVTFYIGEKDGETRMVGVTIAPDGTIGTKDFYDKLGENGATIGHSTYYFPKAPSSRTFPTRAREPIPAVMSSANTGSFPEPAHTKAPPARLIRGRLGRQEPAQERRPL